MRASEESSGADASARLEYMQLLEIHNANRIDYNVRKWETLKFFQSIILAILGGDVVAITAGIDHNLFCHGGIAGLAFAVAIAILPTIVLAAAVLAISNMRRESDLLYGEEAQCFKIAKYLGLDRLLSKEQQWIPGDEHLLMPKWRDYRHGLGSSADAMRFEEWVGDRTKHHQFLRYTRWLFGVEMGVALVLMACTVAVYAGAHFFGACSA